MIGYFDKKAFAELLNLALGKRSINQYERDSGVSAAHISRLMRELVNAPPSPQTIEKLSVKAHNGIRYEDFMKAAGHLSLEPIKELNSVSQDTDKKKSDRNDLEKNQNLHLREVKEIPVFRLKPENREDFFAQDNIIGMEPVPADVMADFAVIVDDDSMSGSRINKGDRVIIRKQQKFVDGQTILVEIPDGTFMIRKAKSTENGIILSPGNQSFEPQYFKREELRIIGIVVQVIFDYI